MDLAHDQGFKAIVATKGADALAMIQSHPRIDAISLDIQLPVIDGWRVLERLKSDLATRHIPVYVITTEEETARAFPMGAIGVLQKPIKTREALEDAFQQIRAALNRQVRHVLVVSPGSELGPRLREAIGGAEIDVLPVRDAAEGLGALDANAFDCVVLDAGREEETGDLEGLSAILRQCGSRRMPVVLWLPESAAVTTETYERLERLGRSGPARAVRSFDRVVDQTLLYIHRPLSTLAPELRARVEQLYETDRVLSGKRVLIVDDDIRNIFAMTSVLERQRMEVISAETGKEAIEKLEQTGVDIVLMDVMMPAMDGYDTMQAIRKSGRYRDLPIIAVTAKAMKGDREKTLQAGAWDYLAKPVDTDQMLLVLRSWLCR
jgi:CheY-like chemotaxis protein